ncbi:MAG: substrate-binding domain-containing protein, partial [Ilumatobacteraceae bacterium]
MKRKHLAALVAAAAVTLAACGGDDSSSSNETSAPSETNAAGGGGSDPGGSIFVSGSSTVEPITAAVAKLFSDANPNVAITVEGPGTGDGFAKFCSGETDISDASRKIKDSEAENCAAAGIEYVELEVAIDGLSVIT